MTLRNGAQMLRQIGRLPLAARIEDSILCRAGCSMQIRQIQAIPRPPAFSQVVFPPGGDGKLPEMPKEPKYDEELGEIEHKTTKRTIEMRGPEWVHTDLIHRQYGVVALTGGMLKSEHFELIRNTVNRNIDNRKKARGSRRFAVWRVDPPWMPITRHRHGTKLGGGKGKIKGYVTPVRGGMVILEVGGHLFEEEALAFLGEICAKMPFKARFVTADELEAQNAERLRIESSNVNQFTMDFVLRWNMQNCSAKLSPYEWAWRGKYK